MVKQISVRVSEEVYNAMQEVAGGERMLYRYVQQWCNSHLHSDSIALPDEVAMSICRFLFNEIDEDELRRVYETHLL